MVVCWFAGLLVWWFAGLLVCWFVGLVVVSVSSLLRFLFFLFPGLVVCWFPLSFLQCSLCLACAFPFAFPSFLCFRVWWFAGSLCLSLSVPSALSVSSLLRFLICFSFLVWWVAGSLGLSFSVPFVLSVSSLLRFLLFFFPGLVVWWFVSLLVVLVVWWCVGLPVCCFGGVVVCWFAGAAHRPTPWGGRDLQCGKLVRQKNPPKIPELLPTPFRRFAGLMVCCFGGLLVCWFAGLLVWWFAGLGGLLVCWFCGLVVSREGKED